MTENFEESLAAVTADLDAARTAHRAGPGEALPALRSAADRLTRVIDESMAQAVLTGGATIRSVGAGAGLSENAVGPRLARTRSLKAYANEAGRVTAAGVQRAQYDQESGALRTSEEAAPLRFKPRRPT